MIYRWYKILSPRIVLNVECDGTCPRALAAPRHVTGTFADNRTHRSEFNQKSSLLFVEIQQIFSLFFVPFYKSNVHLTTKLQLVHSEHDGKYYIKSQEDLYQPNELVKFFWPGGATIVWFLQLIATFSCIAGALLLTPVTWMEQRHAEKLNGVGKKL